MQRKRGYSIVEHQVVGQTGGAARRSYPAQPHNAVHAIHMGGQHAVQTALCECCRSGSAGRVPLSTASSMRPGTKVFCGEPLMKATPSSTAAAAYRLDGATSASPRATAAKKLSAVSFRPLLTCRERGSLSALTSFHCL